MGNGISGGFTGIPGFLGRVGPWSCGEDPGSWSRKRRFLHPKGHKEPFLGKLFPGTAGNCGVLQLLLPRLFLTPELGTDWSRQHKKERTSLVSRNSSPHSPKQSNSISPAFMIRFYSNFFFPKPAFYFI